MRSIALIMTAAAILSLPSTRLHAQTWQMPPEDQRCPSRWGVADQRGSGNLMKPETVLRAAKLIKTGVVRDHGRSAQAVSAVSRASRLLRVALSRPSGSS